MNKKNKKLIILIILILIIIIGIYLIIPKQKEEPLKQDSSENEFQNKQLQSQTFEIKETNNPERKLYIDSQYNFSFQYPSSFVINKFQEAENTSTILVQEKETKKSFQIFISYFDEPGPLTKERILKDLPDLKIENPQQRVLKNGIVALIFFSEESSIGKTREIWFVYKDNLYQISTYKELDQLTAQMLQTWEFN
ncbi:MAG: hypothetical protein GF387_00400 [Candidatus Portnoybacteria bacterium]|nr:hypothetical protein [Candidatus Portnoybacteria bacterium]